MGQDLLLGIDIGTYESKGVLTTPQGKVIAQATIAHKLLFPRAGWAEHDPELTWWGDFCNLSKQLLATEGVSPSDIKGVGVSAIGPDVLPIDENFNPLRMGILYGVDTRAVEEIDELNATSKSCTRLSAQDARHSIKEYIGYAEAPDRERKVTSSKR